MSLSDHKYTDAIESGIWGSHGQEEESQVCKGLLDRIPIVNLLLVGGVGKGGWPGEKEKEVVFALPKL